MVFVCKEKMVFVVFVRKEKMLVLNFYIWKLLISIFFIDSIIRTFLYGVQLRIALFHVKLE